MARGLFVTGTDTGVGKTVLAAALCARFWQDGGRVLAHKPVVTGLDEPPGDWPPDHELLAQVTGQAPEEVSPRRFGPAVSPHLAAELAGTALAPAVLTAAVEDAVALADHAGATLVVEGVGGLLVPLAPRFSVRDLAAALGLPLVIAARPGLGTINHTLLTVEAARAAGLTVAAVVLGPWPDDPGPVERSNAATIEALADVEVATLPNVAAPTGEHLARAAISLDPARWADGPS